MKNHYIHPAFPPPPSLDVILWRYLDFDKFKWLIENQRLFMPSAQFLGDPLEGTTPVGHEAWWKKLIANASSDSERKIIEENFKKITAFANNFRPNYYVSCWHMNSIENAKMWRAYTKSSDSVAIVTTFQVLRDELPEYVEIGMVRYIDYENEELPSLNMFEYITHKNINYCFEREIRAVVLPPPNKGLGFEHFQDNHFESEAQKGFLVYAPKLDIVKLVQRVILHPSASNNFVEKIDEICANSKIDKPIHSIFSGKK